jgi:hypothetical protein
MFGEIFVGNFVENGRKPTKFVTKFATKFWKNGFLGQALVSLKTPRVCSERGSTKTHLTYMSTQCIAVPC